MSYLNNLRAEARNAGKMSGVQRTPKQMAIYVLNGELCRAEATIKELDGLYRTASAEGRDKDHELNDLRNWHISDCQQIRVLSDALEEIVSEQHGGDKCEEVAKTALAAASTSQCRHENWQEHYNGVKCPDCGKEF